MSTTHATRIMKKETKTVNRRRWNRIGSSSNSHIAAGLGNQYQGKHPEWEVRVRYEAKDELCVIEWRAK